MSLARRVRRLERADNASGGSCICTPATCDVLRPNPPYSDRYPDRPNVTCPRCGRPAIRIVLKYDKAPSPRQRDETASSWQRSFSGT